ncbi:MAG: hypothetical protein Q8K30_04980 [Candidatus Gracilibacteria bacterium]|nr:hypothetical protein [Candidatus Gracilibacteria bacterium]
MKNILIKILILIGIIGLINVNFIYNTYAEEESGIVIVVTEKVPGANCTPKDKDKDGVILNYKCNVAKGFGSVTIMLGNIIKYFTYLAALAGVLYIIINGIMYSMGGIDQGMKDEAKKRISGTLIGLLLLFISGVVLNLIAPWIYK